MDFNLVKKTLRKPIIWFGSVIFTLVLIFLLIVLLIPISKENKIVFSCVFVLNFLLMYFISCILNLSKSSISLFYRIIITKEESSEYEVMIKKSNFSYIFITILLISTFFIELTSGSIIKKVSWEENAKETYWVFLIIFLVNLIYFYLYTGVTLYLLNNNADFKNNYIEFYKKCNTKINS
ncbi:hypothetical protein SCORR_v1c00730 [Spiroplasma corruscae]|uniref:Uncharacterized protein n=1 Tax=Spiroplasma corruscae TaxID=216934 RepID=A0A222EMY8_9MOLU|nr:hypothetical protein [Spiroplasma corruscae]ASP27848.1 hypothetical protein SCORR_v1c00730 [Spiroplasma corruscae]